MGERKDSYKIADESFKFDEILDEELFENFGTSDGKGPESSGGCIEFRYSQRNVRNVRNYQRLWRYDDWRSFQG